jgi:hypothetical protein
MIRILREIKKEKGREESENEKASFPLREKGNN